MKCPLSQRTAPLPSAIPRSDVFRRGEPVYASPLVEALNFPPGPESASPTSFTDSGHLLYSDPASAPRPDRSGPLGRPSVLETGFPPDILSDGPRTGAFPENPFTPSFSSSLISRVTQDSVEETPRSPSDVSLPRPDVELYEVAGSEREGW